MSNQEQIGFPVVDLKIGVKIYDLVQQAYHFKQIKKGVNEVIKSLKKDQTEIVILAADANPIEMLMNLPNICQEKNISYCFVHSNSALGRACGIKRPTMAASIIFKENSQINSQIVELKDIIDQIYS